MVCEEDAILPGLPVVGGLTYRELHAFQHGAYEGFFRLYETESVYEKERHYWRAGYLVGWGGRAAFALRYGFKPATPAHSSERSARSGENGGEEWRGYH